MNGRRAGRKVLGHTLARNFEGLGAAGERHRGGLVGGDVAEDVILSFHAVITAPEMGLSVQWRAGFVPKSETSSSGWSKGSGRSSTEYTAPNTARFAPIPSAS